MRFTLENDGAPTIAVAIYDAIIITRALKLFERMRNVLSRESTLYILAPERSSK